MDSPLNSSTARWRYGLWAVISSFLAVFSCLLLAAMRYDTPGAAAAFVAPAITAIGTLAAAYFGVQAGSAGKAEAEAAREEAHMQALRLAAVADPDKALTVLNRPVEPRPLDEGDDAAKRRAAEDQEADRWGSPTAVVNASTTDRRDVAAAQQAGQAVDAPSGGPSTHPAAEPER